MKDDLELDDKNWEEVQKLHSEGKLNPKTVFVYICDLLAIPIMRCQNTDEPI